MSKVSSRTLSSLLGLAALFVAGPVHEAAATDTYSSVTILRAKDSTSLVQRYAGLLQDQIRRRCGVTVQVSDYTSDGDNDAVEGLTVVLGLAAPGAMQALLEGANVTLPDDLDPGPEGFQLSFDSKVEKPRVIIAGVDERGVLYGIGELLRQTHFLEKSVSLPAQLDIRSAPAFEVRGTEVSQGRTITALTHSRKWTEDEWQQAVIGYALAGANTFGIGHSSPDKESRFTFVKSLGLKTLISLSPNAGNGPPEWQATEAIGRPGYLCLSVPAARQHILDEVDKRFRDAPPVDYVRMYSGDGGGCECERCAPYGGTYIRICHDIAAIIHRYEPNVQIFATNQKLDNAGDEAIFSYLQHNPSGWLRALCYGPGSNAMGWMPGRRQDHRMDLFRYPGFGPMGRYCQEIVHQLPPNVDLVFFTDLTHWIYSEYGLMDHAMVPDRNHDVAPHWGHEPYDVHPDPALEQVYDRRTFHARPRAYYHAFQETMRYGIGDVTYSEGHHDHFNQWMWQRLLWIPHTSLDDVVAEYARTFFGPEAASLMAQAIFQLEQNLSTPIEHNDGIDCLYDLVAKAGRVMPSWTMKNNYLWRQYMQKAALDKYIQLRVLRQEAQERDCEKAAAKGLSTGHIDATVQRMKDLLAQPAETPEMIKLKADAEKWGDESEAIYGVRSEGYFNLDQDFVGLGWLQSQVNRAANATTSEAQQQALHDIAYYEDPGEGGFYDDAGDRARSPHLVYGWPFGEDDDVSPTNRPSQRNMAFTTDEQRGVTFRYTGLDPQAHYRARFTLVRPRYSPRYAKFQHQTSESIYANGHVLAKDLEVPEYTAGFFEYDIPREATADGTLTIWFEKAPGVGKGTPSQVTVWRDTGGWGTLVSEVWLMKKKPATSAR